MPRPDRIDHYELVDDIARGAFGAVFRARDLELGREVAIKVLLARDNDGTDPERRFLREGEALARVRHPHIVSVHGVGETRGQPYLVLDYVQGENLEQRIERDGPLDPEEAAALIRILASALQHIHEQGLLHRDLKPANVLLRAEDGAPLLTDFGLAHDEVSDRTRLSQTGHMLGTPGFWAPEQARGDKLQLGPTTDVYGLGAVYYACLTGEPPIVGDSLFEVLAAGEIGRIDPPSRLRPGLSAKVDRVCLQALARNPQDRYPSAASFADDLERLQSGSSVQARYRRRLPSTPVAVTLLLLLAVAGGLALWSGWIRPRQVGDRLDRVKLLVDKHRYTEAKPLADALVEFEPGSPLAWSLKGKIALSGGDRTAAGECVERALALRPGFVPALLIRASLRLKKDPEGALADYDAAISQEPDLTPARYGRSFLRRAKGNLAGAADDLGHALSCEPEPDAGRTTTYADLLHQLKRFAEAEAACDRAITLLGANPTGADRSRANRARYLRGTIRKDRGNLPGAEADWTAATRLVPNSVSTWYRLGSLRYDLKDYEGAVKAFGKTVDISPNYGPGLVRRGRAHHKLRQYRRALADYDRGLQRPLTPQDTLSIRFRRGDVRARLLDLPGAMRDYSAVLKKQPTHLPALLRRAELRVQLGSLVQARRDYDRALAQIPRDDPRHAKVLQRRKQLIALQESARKIQGR